MDFRTELAKWGYSEGNSIDVDILVNEILPSLSSQQERMYSEEDMIEFGEWMKILPLTISGFVIKDTNIVIKTTKELLKYWFEQFKKK
jgi:hypothetical protein